MHQRLTVANLVVPCGARWEDFQAYVDEREPKMLRAFTSLEVNPAGQYDLKHIKSKCSAPLGSAEIVSNCTSC